MPIPVMVRLGALSLSEMAPVGSLPVTTALKASTAFAPCSVWPLKELVVNVPAVVSVPSVPVAGLAFSLIPDWSVTSLILPVSPATAALMLIASPAVPAAFTVMFPPPTTLMPTPVGMPVAAAPAILTAPVELTVTLPPPAWPM